MRQWVGSASAPDEARNSINKISITYIQQVDVLPAELQESRRQLDELRTKCDATPSNKRFRHHEGVAGVFIP